MPEPDCFIRYRIGYGTLQPCLGCQRAALLRGILRQESPTYTYWRRATRASRGFKMVLFTDRRKTFVGGKLDTTFFKLNKIPQITCVQYS